VYFVTLAGAVNKIKEDGKNLKLNLQVPSEEKIYHKK